MDSDSVNVRALADEPVMHSKPTKTRSGKGVTISYVNGPDSSPQQFYVSPTKEDLAILLRPRPVFAKEAEAEAYEQAYQAVFERLCRVETNWHDSTVTTKEGQTFYDETGKVTMLVGIYPDPVYEAGLHAIDTAHKNAIKSCGMNWFSGSEQQTRKFYDGYKSVMLLSGKDDVPDEQKKLCMRMKIRPGPNQNTDTQIVIWDTVTGTPRQGSVREVTLGSRIIPVVKNGGIYYRGKDECGGMLFCTAMIVFPHVKRSGVDVLSSLGIDLTNVFPAALTAQTSAASAASAEPAGAAPFTEPDTNTVISGPTWGVRDGLAVSGQADPTLFP
jgi:hypothetical protein